MYHRSALLALLILALAAPLARAGVGFQYLTISDPQGPPIEVGVWYPTDAAPAPTHIELFKDLVAAGGRVKGEALPLVVISHGLGGSFGGHHDTAMALAEAGFVAAALTHTTDNWRDHSRAVGTLRDRPRQLKLLIDYMLSAWPDRDHIDARRIGAFGFSLGGFTVLTAAGGEPDMAKTAPYCLAHPAFFDCRLIASSHPSSPVNGAWTHDPRIKAVVAAAPAYGFTFGEAGLAQVRQPVQLWRAADDHVLPYPFYADAVRGSLPTAPDFHVIEHADHYDLLAPCSDELAKLVPEICTSQPGFDRTAFHAAFNREVVAFFLRSLPPPATSPALAAAGAFRNGD